MPDAGAAWRSRWIDTGLRSISLVSAAIGGGMVALKNSVCRFAGSIPQDLPDLRQEPHVEHPVRFVEHQELEVGELRVRRPQMIEEPSRRRDQHVDAAAERVLLRAHADAAENRRRR